VQTLELNSFPPAEPVMAKLPASRFPDPADVYICDRCGTDITKHLHQGRAHVWRPIGSAWYVCRCGARYPSGAVEWDDLGPWERKQRAWQLGIAPILAALLLIPAVIAYFTFRYRSFVLLAALVLVLIPSAVFATLFGLVVFEAFEIIASIWRTRITATSSGRSA
jgi:hypothetical protein